MAHQHTTKSSTTCIATRRTPKLQHKLQHRVALFDVGATVNPLTIDIRAHNPMAEPDSTETSLETLKGLVSDLELLLSADADELKALDELKRLRQDIRAVATGREADARRVIQGSLPACEDFLHV